MFHYQDNIKIPFFMSLKCYPLSLWIWSSFSSPQELSNDTWFNLRIALVIVSIDPCQDLIIKLRKYCKKKVVYSQRSRHYWNRLHETIPTSPFSVILVHNNFLNGFVWKPLFGPSQVFILWYKDVCVCVCMLYTLKLAKFLQTCCGWGLCIVVSCKKKVCFLWWFSDLGVLVVFFFGIILFFEEE
jgi:hypothetical protein